MDKKIQLLIVVVIIMLVGIIGIKIVENNGKTKKTSVEISEKETVEEEKKESEKADINSAGEDELRFAGISKAAIDKIITYKYKMGAVESFENLDSVKGIGKATLEKLKKKFIIDNETVKDKIKKININSADAEIMIWLGLTKKEIKKVEDWKKARGTIFSNVEFAAIVGNEKYDKLKERIYYKDY